LWITEHVDLPGSLIDDQRNGTLVVFAGAGVSIGPPSNLPDFKQLAAQVAEGTLAREDGEPIDRFLGRLEKKRGVEVHLRIWNIISDPNSKPTPLHNSLLSLFRTPDAVRIVTTNFDRHLSTVAEKLFQDDIEIYCAPALPLGRRFNGIIYLHGVVDKGPETFVATDRDFGRAYLTDGWATRFLCEMFAEYTVLFVGYSHDDPVMRYLARGIASETPRYALAEYGQDEHWRFLGITPVTCLLKDKLNRYSALGEALTAWVKRAKMGALDDEREIREIVKSNPPLEKETADYVEDALKDLVKLRFFTRHARAPEWLRWAESKQAFCKLFQTNERVDELSQEIGDWFAQNFVYEYPDEALALVQRQGQKLNPFLQNVIVHRLTFPKPRPGAETLAKWVTVLLGSTSSDWRPRSLEHLLEKCRYPEDKITALLLFEYLTRPRLKLKTLFGFPPGGSSATEQLDMDIAIEGDEHYLKRSWNVIFQPNLADFSEKLEPIVTRHLTQTHFLLRAINQANDRRDPVSFLRSTIEPCEEDRYGGKLDIVIDAARNIIEWMLKHQSDQAYAVIERWSASGIPLLRRLAIHGITENPKIHPNEKIAWILERDWLYTSGIRHEVFRLIGKAYPNATEPARVRLLERVDRGPMEEAAKNLRERMVYNLLVWLRNAAPNCSFAAAHLKAVQEAHPDFKPPEHPDLHYWTVESEGPRSPLTVEELLGKSPQKTIDWLLVYQGDKFTGPDRKDLLTAIIEAVGQSFKWSWQLVMVLQEKEKWSSDIWGSIFNGWQKESLTKNQWRKVLTLLTRHSQLYRFARPVADLLEQGVRKGQGELPLSCLPLAEDLAGHLFDACCKALRDKEAVDKEDWLSRAINHPGGMIVEFWLQALSKRRAEAGENWVGLSPKYKQYFGKVLSGKSYTAQLGRVVLVSQMRFLFALDADWTRKNILPLLDWSSDQRRTQQAWHGYLLGGGRWHEALLPSLLPLYQQSFCKLSDELSSMRDRFCEHLASIALYSSSNPMKDGWLQKFLLTSDRESHRSWAANLGRQLASLNEESVRNLWSRWMDSYWERRNTGIPLLLSQDEKEEMVLWSIRLEAVFPAVVEKICAASAPTLKQTYLYYELVEKGFATKYPIPLTRLLLHLLPEADKSFLHCREVEGLVRSLVGSTASSGDLLLVCERLARLGCPNASELKELVEESNNS